MQCLQCGKRLPLLRKLGGGGEFCSEAHRKAFIQEQEAMALSRLIDAQQRSQQAQRKAEKKKAAANAKKNPDGRDVPLLGPLVDPPGIVEWSWHSLRKEPGEPTESRLDLLRPRAVFRFSCKMRVPGQCPLELEFLAPQVEKPRAARFPGAEPVEPDTQVVALATLTSRRLVLQTSADPVDSRETGDPASVDDSILPAADLVCWQPQIEVRALPAQFCPIQPGGISLRRDWAPDAIPHARLQPDSGRLFSETPPEEHYSAERMLPVAPPIRAMAAAPGGAQLEMAAATLDLAIPPHHTVFSPRLPEPSHSTLSLSQPAVADMHVVVRIAAPVDFEARPAYPRRNGGFAAGLQPPPKVGVPLVQAQGGNRLVLLETRVDEPCIPVRHPSCKPIPAIDFEPPAYPMRQLRLYPRGKGELRDWRIGVASAPIPPLVDGAVVLVWRARPVCDWVPTMAGLLPLSYEIAPHRVEAHLAVHPEAPFEFHAHAGGGGGRMDPPGHSTLGGGPEPERPRRLLPIPIEQIVPPQGRLQPLGVPDVEEMAPPMIRARSKALPITPELAPAPFGEGLAREVAERVRGVWQAVPAIAKWGSLAMAVALAASTLIPRSGNMTAALGSTPSLPFLSVSWESVQRNIMERAAVSLTDDFRAGLSNWDGDGSWAQQWSYDSSGFVRTGPLALLTPSRGLRDYRMEFLGQIESQSLGWVVRARDTHNYQAIKLAIVSPGPVPEVVIQRYVVLGGKAGPVHQKRLPLEVRSDTMYRVATEVRGSNYSLMVQDMVVDSWTEDRLESGGVGLFSAKGAQARVRWVGVWHQYDTLGRLCALLAPHGLAGSEREEQ